MPHAIITSLKRPSSYSHCPLKKRPLKYDPLEDSNSDSDLSCKGASPPIPLDPSEPENLSTKPEDLRLIGGIKEKAVQLSPPPISVVAHPNPAHQHELFRPTTTVIAHSNGNRPLGPLNFNAPANWTSKIHIHHQNHHYPPHPQVIQEPPRYPYHYPSHFVVPVHYRGGVETPPHVSPPLTNEPAYPVLRIEEPHNNRPTPNYTELANYHNYQPLSPPSSHSPNDSSSRDSSSVISSDKASPIPIVPINVNGSVRYQCPDCNKSYSTYSGLSKHMQFHCASQNKKSFVCKFCDKIYTSLGALKMHIRTHTLPCKCNICGKAFSRPWLLQGHIRTHTGEKPFTCQHCHRAFADRSNLRAHLQTHSEVKKYCCKSCSKTFSRMSLLIKHEEGGCSCMITTCD